MKTVLIVDDVESVRFFHKLLVTQAGYQTLTAATGAQALALIDAAPVDLVVLDLMMPGMSGLEFLQELRRRPTGARVPVLVISSERPPEGVAGPNTSGPCDYLQKPLTPARLLEAIHRLLA